jgi:putative tricarboxylic transport membrane protein
MTIPLLIELIVITALGVVSIIEGIRLIGLPKIQYDPLGPEFYSLGLGLLLVIMGWAYFVSQIRKAPERIKGVKAAEPEGPAQRAYRVMMIGMIAAMVIYIFLIGLIGYLLASAIFFLLINRVMGYRSWLTNLAATAIMTVSYYVVFVKLMQTIFPRGSLLNF